MGRSVKKHGITRNKIKAKMTYITITQAAELTGINYDAIMKAYQRGEIKSPGKDEKSNVLITVESLLHFYPDSRSTFIRNQHEIYGIRFKERKKGSEKTFTSVKDPTKVMTYKEIRKVLLDQFMQLGRDQYEEKLTLCKSFMEEFPGCKGLSAPTMFRQAAMKRINGKEAHERKAREDQGKKRIDKFDWCWKDFETWFLKYFLNQPGDNNRYAGGNVSKSYKFALMEIARQHGHPLPDYKDFLMMRKEMEKVLGKPVPTEAYAFQIARKPIHIAARKYRFQKNDHYMDTLPIMRWDNFRMYRFMECIQSDWHTLHERFKVVLPSGKIGTKCYNIIIWVESKTGCIVQWNRHVGSSASGDRTALSLIELIRKAGRPEKFRFDNGMEFINSRNMNAIRRLYRPDEANQFERVSKARPHQGWQKIPERIFKQLENYLQQSDGYSGSNREVAARPDLGTSPVEAVHTLEEIDELIENIIKTYNHEWIEVNLKYADGLSDTDLIFEGSQGPKLRRDQKIKVRRIDLYNAFHHKFTRTIVQDDELAMNFGIPEDIIVSNSCIMKNWAGERFYYLPPQEQATILTQYNGEKVEVRYDPSSEYGLSKMFVFHQERYITTVYCDLLNGYTKEQADDYRKAKAKINKLLRELNDQYVFKKAIDRQLGMALEKETEFTDKSAGKILVFNPDAHRFAEQRDHDTEAIHEMADIRKDVADSPWDFSESAGGYINYDTGEFSETLPENN